MSRGDAVAKVLGGPDLAWIRTRARAHLEAGRPLPETLTLRDPSDAERRAYAELVGRPLRSRGPLVAETAAIDAVLRGSGIAPEGLAGALARLDGAIVLRADAARAHREAWDAAFAPLRAAVEKRRDDAWTSARLATWLEDLRSAPGRIARDPTEAEPTLQALARVVAELPTDAPEPLARFAARTLGGAHALDDDTAIAGPAVRAAAAIGGVRPPNDGGVDAAWRRRAWAAVGVVRDELSSSVLVLGLPGDARMATGRILELGRVTGEPLVLTLRQLRGSAVGDLRGRVVSCCENPSVVAAAAEEHGVHCAPLVCTAGQPGAATTEVLRACVRAGAVVRHHGDFDPSGVRIMALLRRRHDAVPWRFGASDYRAAVGRRSDVSTSWSADQVPATPWDPALADAMARLGVQAEEELMLDELVADLGSD